MHNEPHPLAGKTVRLMIREETSNGLNDELREQEYDVEDWQDRVMKKSWMEMSGNPAAIKYALRAGFAGIPADDEAVYGHVGPFGHIVHVSELGPVV